MSSVEMLSSSRHPEYSIHFSNEDREWVATSSEFPSLSWLAATPDKALEGLNRLIAEVQDDLEIERRQQHELAMKYYEKLREG